MPQDDNGDIELQGLSFVLNFDSSDFLIDYDFVGQCFVLLIV